LCGPDHRVIGGSVGGVLTTIGTVQVMATFRLCWCNTIKIRCIHSILLNFEVLYSY